MAILQILINNPLGAQYTWLGRKNAYAYDRGK